MPGWRSNPTRPLQVPFGGSPSWSGLGVSSWLPSATHRKQGACPHWATREETGRLSSRRRQPSHVLSDQERAGSLPRRGLAQLSLPGPAPHLRQQNSRSHSLPRAGHSPHQLPQRRGQAGAKQHFGSGQGAAAGSPSHLENSPDRPPRGHLGHCEEGRPRPPTSPAPERSPVRPSALRSGPPGAASASAGPRALRLRCWLISRPRLELTTQTDVGSDEHFQCMDKELHLSTSTSPLTIII